MDELKKRGALSIEEREFIRSKFDTQDAAWIAEQLNRTESHIIKYIAKMSVVERVKPEIEAEEKENKEILAKLMARPTWKDITRQYTDDELITVKYHWVKLFKQFKEDVTHGEELQIFDLISLEIIKDRNKKERALALREIHSKEELLHRELSKPQEERRLDYISALEHELDMARAAQNEKNKEFNDAIDRSGKILHAMKSTRDQRYKDIANGSQTFLSFMKMMSDTKYRQQESREAELYRLAVEKEKERLSQYHEFDDGEVDQPLLTPETVMQVEEE